jgi:hypothetical protein
MGVWHDPHHRSPIAVNWCSLEMSILGRYRWFVPTGQKKFNTNLTELNQITIVQQVFF